MKEPHSLLTSLEAKALDRKAQEQLGIPALILMENAGIGLAGQAIKAGRKHPGKIAVVCGSGNNGGDGFCAARHLLLRGFKPKVYLAGKASKVVNEAGVNLNAWLRLKQKIIEIKPANLGQVARELKRSGLIIDALLGVGLKGGVRPFCRRVIEIINAAGAYVLAVDIPSGLDATTGKVLGASVKAGMTVTFVAKKRGMVYGEGRGYCGRILVNPIGLPNRYLINLRAR